MVKKNTSPEPVKTPKLEPKVGKSSLTPVHFDEMNTPQLEPKVSINKLPVGQGGLNIRRRTASPGRQVQFFFLHIKTFPNALKIVGKPKHPMFLSKQSDWVLHFKESSPKWVRMIIIKK